MRRPYSGNPGITLKSNSYEKIKKMKLAMMLYVSCCHLYFFQQFLTSRNLGELLPTTMPVLKTSSTAVKGNTASRSKGGGCKLEELPGGYMGKMLVYRSGAVKLKLGDTLYNVCAGMEGTFAQDVVAMNTAEKRCCAVAEVDKRAILIPDIEAITANMADL
ncbi:hypothetical protein LINPERHAP1_LOCUS4251 [Linum perenne]